jgi:hypothetical protein
MMPNSNVIFQIFQKSCHVNKIYNKQIHVSMNNYGKWYSMREKHT